MSGRVSPHPRSSASADAARPALILIVDDFDDNREMYAEFLRFTGYRVEEAANGLEALEKAFGLLPDVIVMDLSLPGVDGWEVTRRLKADGRTGHIPVIAVTGHALAGHSQGALEAGCDAFVTKPCLPEDLATEIQRLLDAGPAKSRSKTGRP
jgi:two-component system, cell cycle response regulator DivK